MNILIIYAFLGQRILLFKLPKPSLIAAAVIAILMVVPPIIFGMLKFTHAPHEIATPWLFTIFSLAAFNNHLQSLTMMSVLFPLLSQWGNTCCRWI
jgi:hypothetical protein